MTDIQKIYYVNEPNRVETGPVQFNDDWPGVFIRGDNAAYYAIMLRNYIEYGDTAQFGIAKLVVEDLANLLGSCRV